MSLALRVSVCLAVLVLCACNGDDGKEPVERESRTDCAAPVRAGSPVELRFSVTGRPSRDLTSQAATALCARLRDLGVAEFQVTPSSGAEIEVRVPRGSQRDVTEAAQPGQLRFYDFEPNVLGDRGPDDPFRGSRALYQAVLVASRAQPRAEPTDVPPAAPKLSPAQADRRNDTAGARLYLFDESRQPLAGPAPSRAALTPGGRTPPGGRVLAVPQGIVVVEDQRAENQPESVRSFFVLEDDSELSGPDLANPEQSTDQQTQEPIVTMEFTDEGRAAFSSVTKRIAQRGAKVSLPAGADEQQRQATLQRFAITLDDQIVSVATIDHRENPKGIDGGTGAQISGIGSVEEARRLVALLGSEPLPAELVPLP